MSDAMEGSQAYHAAIVTDVDIETQQIADIPIRLLSWYGRDSARSPT